MFAPVNGSPVDVVGAAPVDVPLAVGGVVGLDSVAPWIRSDVVGVVPTAVVLDVLPDTAALVVEVLLPGCVVVVLLLELELVVVLVLVLVVVEVLVEVVVVDGTTHVSPSATVVERVRIAPSDAQVPETVSVTMPVVAPGTSVDAEVTPFEGTGFV